MSLKSRYIIISYICSGINLYAMLTGQLPFHVEPINIAALHEKIMKGAKIPNHLTEGIDII